WMNRCDPLSIHQHSKSFTPCRNGVSPVLICKSGSGLGPCSYCYSHECSSRLWVGGRDKPYRYANLSLHQDVCYRATSFGHLTCDTSPALSLGNRTSHLQLSQQTSQPVEKLFLWL